MTKPVPVFERAHYPIAEVVRLRVSSFCSITHGFRVQRYFVTGHAAIRLIRDLKKHFNFLSIFQIFLNPIAQTERTHGRAAQRGMSRHRI